MSTRLVDNNTRVWWVTTLSSTTSPTATQINAGVALETFLPPDGVDVSPDQNFVDVSALNSASELQSLGRTKVDMSLTMFRRATDTAWTTFASNPAGFIVIRRGVVNTTTGAASQKVEVYPALAGVRAPMKPAANEAEKFTVKFGLTADYVTEATVA